MTAFLNNLGDRILNSDAAEMLGEDGDSCCPSCVCPLPSVTATLVANGLGCTNCHFYSGPISPIGYVGNAAISGVDGAYVLPKEPSPFSCSTCFYHLIVPGTYGTVRRGTGACDTTANLVSLEIIAAMTVTTGIWFFQASLMDSAGSLWNITDTCTQTPCNIVSAPFGGALNTTYFNGMSIFDSLGRVVSCQAPCTDAAGNVAGRNICTASASIIVSPP